MGGWNNFKMKPVKEFPCDNNIQLTIEEERIRVEMQANLNTNRAYRSPEQNQEYNREYYREYRQTHKEAISEYQQEYHQRNKEVLNEQKKEYYQTHKEDTNKAHKKYYQTHKKHLKCECGSTVFNKCMSLHLQSKKHLKFIALTDVKP